MDKDKALDIAAKITSAMIAAGFMPPAVHGKSMNDAAVASMDLYDEVVKQLIQYDPSR